MQNVVWYVLFCSTNPAKIDASFGFVMSFFLRLFHLPFENLKMNIPDGENSAMSLRMCFPTLNNTYCDLFRNINAMCAINLRAILFQARGKFLVFSQCFSQVQGHNIALLDIFMSILWKFYYTIKDFGTL